ELDRRPRLGERGLRRGELVVGLRQALVRRRALLVVPRVDAGALGGVRVGDRAQPGDQVGVRQRPNPYGMIVSAVRCTERSKYRPRHGRGYHAGPPGCGESAVSSAPWTSSPTQAPIASSRAAT